MSSEFSARLFVTLGAYLCLTACHPNYKCSDLGTCADEVNDASVTENPDTPRSDAGRTDANGSASEGGDAHADSDAASGQTSSSSESVTGGTTCFSDASCTTQDGQTLEPCDTDERCPTATPICVVVSEERVCIQCATNEHCAGHPSGEVCVGRVCKACNATSNEGCGEETPWCVESTESAADETEASNAHCAECSQDEQCASGGGVCAEERCTPCDIGTNRGCSGDMPFCVGASEGDSSEEAFPQCVECRTVEDCGDRGKACVQGTCVQCTANEHCTDPNASACDVATNTCVGCRAVGECGHLSETPACNVETATCVECTREESLACVNDNGEPTLCVTVPSAEQWSCSDKRAGVGIQCTDCINDAQCESGYACVAEEFDGASTGQFVCLRQTLEGADGCSYPFKGVVQATSEGGISGTFCRPALTTCQGYNHFEKGPCASDDSCGVDGVADGFCVENADSKVCTYECNPANNELDCRTGSTCTLEVNLDGGEVRSVCSVGL
jgi:hypothetical protein